MSPFRYLCALFVITLAGIDGVALAAEPPLPAFTAHYRLLQDGAPIGKATLTLAPGDDGTWTFTTASQGTSGLASLLAANTREVSTFKWAGDLPQGIRYDYILKTALKTKQRTVNFDWARHVIDVNDNGSFSFATQPGALERHTVPLAIAAGLAAGKTSFTLPVAVRDRVESQHYASQGKQTLTVPAGNFDATRVSRSDGGDAFEAWFAPGKLPAPIKIVQRGKRDFTLELTDWSAQP